MGTTRTKKGMRGLALALAALLAAAAIACGAPLQAMADEQPAIEALDEEHVIGSEVDVADQTTYLELSTGTLASVDYGDTRGTTKKDLVTTQNMDGGAEAWALCVPVTNNSSGVTFKDIVLSFENVGTLDGESIDLTLTITEAEFDEVQDTSTMNNHNCSFGSGAADGSEGWASVVELYDDHMEFGGAYVTYGEDGEDPDADKTSTYTYIGRITLDYEVEVTYHESGKAVEGDFYQVYSDLDTDNGYALERVRFLDGFDEFYVYDECLLVTDEDSEGRMFGCDWLLGTSDEKGIYYSEDGEKHTDVEDPEYRVAGVIAPTDSSTTTARWNAGGCSTAFKLYLQGDEDRDVQKTVDEAYCDYGDIVTWTISFDMPEYRVDWFSNDLLESLVVVDELPIGFEYIDGSAELAWEDGEAPDFSVSKSGSADYYGETLTFTIDEEWLQDADNYTGGYLTLTIETLVGEDANNSNVNNATVYYDGNGLGAQATTRLASTGELQIYKYVADGTDAAKKKEFTFTVTLSDTSGSYDILVDGEEAGSVVAGIGTVELSSGQTATIEGIPHGTTYSVEETSSSSAYEASWANQTGTVAGGATTVCRCTNAYSCSGSFQLQAAKNMDGRATTPGEFEFEVLDEDGEVVAVACNDEDDAVYFDEITVTEEGSWTYTIREVDGGLGGVVYDESEHTATVTAKDTSGNGTLTCTIVYSDTSGAGGVPAFDNEYHATGSWTPVAKKTLDGGTDDLLYYSFDFALKDSSGNVVATATSDTVGDVSFEAVEYDEDDVGTHRYTLSELAGEDKDIVYDDKEVAVTVKVTDDGDGTLTATASYGGSSEAPTFENGYDGHETLLPSAGQIGGVAAAAGGVALVGAGAAMGLQRFRRRRGSARPSVRR